MRILLVHTVLAAPSIFPFPSIFRIVPLMSTKQEMREHAREVRKSLQDQYQGSIEVQNLSQVFLGQVQPGKDKIISIYWPIGSELDTKFLIDDLIRDGYKIALPITPPKTDDHTKRLLTFRLWDGKTDLVPGNFKTLVPPEEGAQVEPDIFLIPLLAFDRKGNRMGYGQGHYDATLSAARAKKEILAIGVGYGEQAVLFNLPTEPHDQKLDMVLTPSAVHDYR